MLTDQVKSVDWRSHQATQMGTLAPAELAELRAKILALIGGIAAAAN